MNNTSIMLIDPENYNAGEIYQIVGQIAKEINFLADVLVDKGYLTKETVMDESDGKTKTYVTIVH